MNVNFTTKKNDRLPELVIIARDSLGPVDLTGFTAVFRMVNVLTGATKIQTAATIEPDPVFTADANTDALISNVHGIAQDQDLTLTSTGVLPGGLSASQRYFAVNVTANSLKLALSKGGAAVNVTDAGSGTHTLIVGKISYQWASGDTDTPGTYQGQIETTKDAKRLTFPNDSNITLEILSDLTDASDRTVAIFAVMDRVQPQAAPKLTQGQIELEVDRALLATTWQPLTAYFPGAEVVPPVRNGYAYRCTRAGTSGPALSQNEWLFDTYETFSDGQGDSVVYWENVGSDRYNRGIAGAETNPYDIGKAARSCWLIKARKASQAIDDGDLSFSQLHAQCLAQAGAFQPFRRATRIVRSY